MRLNRSFSSVVLLFLLAGCLPTKYPRKKMPYLIDRPDQQRSQTENFPSLGTESIISDTVLMTTGSLYGKYLKITLRDPSQDSSWAKVLMSELNATTVTSWTESFKQTDYSGILLDLRTSVLETDYRMISYQAGTTEGNDVSEKNISFLILCDNQQAGRLRFLQDIQDQLKSLQIVLEGPTIQYNTTDNKGCFSKNLSDYNEF